MIKYLKGTWDSVKVLIGTFSTQGWIATRRHGIQRKRGKQEKHNSKSYLKAHNLQVPINPKTTTIYKSKTFLRKKIQESSYAMEEIVDKVIFWAAIYSGT